MRFWSTLHWDEAIPHLVPPAGPGPLPCCKLSFLPVQKVLKYLEREGVDVNHLHNGDAPLHSYVRRRDKHKLSCLMAFLIHSKCDIDMKNKDGETALHLACKVNNYAPSIVDVTHFLVIGGTVQCKFPPLPHSHYIVCKRKGCLNHLVSLCGVGVGVSSRIVIYVLVHIFVVRES